MSDMAALGYDPPAGWVQATLAALERDRDANHALLQAACVACTVGCLDQQDETTRHAVAQAAHEVQVPSHCVYCAYIYAYLFDCFPSALISQRCMLALVCTITFLSIL